MDKREKIKKMEFFKNSEIIYAGLFLVLMIIFSILDVLELPIVQIIGNLLTGIYVIIKIIDNLIAKEYYTLKHQIAGEEYLKSILSTLPKEYKVFYNVEMDYNEHKLDLVSLVIGPTGIYIVDSKNYKGRVYGDVNSSLLTYEKTSRRGNTYINNVDNPIKQLNKNINRLSIILLDKSIITNVNGYIYLMNGVIDVYSDKLIISPHELLTTIQNNEHVLSETDINDIINKLKLN